MKEIKAVFNFLQKEKLILTTAESCTAGRVINLLAKIPGSGSCLDIGYVVYSTSAKKKILKVKQRTIDKYSLTSEEVALEMAMGALRNSNANSVIATTGIAGPESMDGIPKGTVCFAWGFRFLDQIIFFSDTQHFPGNRTQVLTNAAKFVLIKIPHFYQSAKP